MLSDPLDQASISFRLGIQSVSDKKPEEARLATTSMRGVAQSRGGEGGMIEGLFAARLDAARGGRRSRGGRIGHAFSHTASRDCDEIQMNVARTSTPSSASSPEAISSLSPDIKNLF